MSNESKKKEQDYIYLVNKHKADIIDRCNNLERRAQEFIRNKGYVGSVIVNHAMLNIMVIDYFADLDRLKDFHDIEHANKNKITAYTVYWWLRRRPLQVVVDNENTIENAKDNEKLVYVNEEFATSLILKDIFDIDKEEIKSNEKMRKYFEHVFYYLKYRLLDAQAIEWLMATADVSKEIGKIKVEKGHS